MAPGYPRRPEPGPDVGSPRDNGRMKLWFDQRQRTYLEFGKSLRCHLLRHERDGRGCDGMFTSFLGPAGTVCMCRCHSAAVARRVTARPPSDLRPHVGVVTMAEAAENLRTVGALMRAQDRALLARPDLQQSIAQVQRSKGTVVRPRKGADG